MPRLILHIGAEKTGTTSLQQSAEHCHGSALWFPSREFGGLSMPLLAYAFGKPNRVPDAVLRVRQRFGDISPSAARDLIAGEIRRQQDLPVLLSCELLYSRFDRDGYAGLRDFLSEHSNDVSVCCVLRDVRPVIDGLWCESLKAGIVVDDPARPNSVLYGFDNGGFFDFTQKINDLRWVYRESLILLRYEVLAADGQLIPRFFNALELSCKAQDIALNPRLNHAQAWALQRLNQLTRKMPYRSLPFRIMRRGLRWLLSGFGRAFVPTDSIPAMKSVSFRRGVANAQRQLDELFDGTTG